MIVNTQVLMSIIEGLVKVQPRRFLTVDVVTATIISSLPVNNIALRSAVR